MFAHTVMSFIHLLLAAPSPTPSGAAGAILQGAGQACSGSCGNSDFSVILKDGANILTYLVGSVSVLMIIYGGFRYVISRGDASQIKVAKDTILYAVVGVIVALVAFAVVNFVAKTVK